MSFRGRSLWWIAGLCACEFALSTILSFSALAGTEACDPTCPCQRIISLAPSITETLSALELTSNIVGVTRYDNYPDAVKSLPKIGSFFDLNTEQILTLNPTHIFVPKESYSQIQTLKNLKFNVIPINQNTVSEIDNSIKKIGEICKVTNLAKELLLKIKEKINKIKLDNPNLKSKKVLIIVGADKDKIYISGDDGFYFELLSFVGINSVYKGKTTAFSAVTEEGLLGFEPDFVIEIGEPNQPNSIVKKQFADSKFEKIQELLKKLIYVNDDFLSVPGPRYPEVLQKIIQVYHLDGKIS